MTFAIVRKCMCACIVFCCVTTTQLIAEEIATIAIRPPSPGVFPTDRWIREERPEITSQVVPMRELFAALVKLPESDAVEIERAYDDRIVLMSEFPAPKLRQRVDAVCKKHQSLLDLLRRVKWASPSDEMIAMPEVTERYKLLLPLIRLSVLNSLRELSLGNEQSASQTLAASFGFARNMMLAIGAVNHLVSLEAEGMLIRSLFDLQQVGAKDLTPIITGLIRSAPMQKQIDRARWLSVCDELPLLFDRPRQPAEWLDNYKTTMRRFGNAAPDLSASEAELFGRQLQTVVSTGKNVKALSINLQYEHGLLKEFQDRPKDVPTVKRFQPMKGVVPVADYAESILDSETSKKLSKRNRELLAAAHCIEIIRRESAEQNGWLKKGDVEIQSCISKETQGLKPSVAIEGTVSPSYVITLPSFSFRWNSVYVSTEGGFSNE